MTAAPDEPTRAALRAWLGDIRALRAARPPDLTPYEKSIAAATGLTDPLDLAEVEELMRSGGDLCGLDDLAPAEFGAAARRALADALVIGAVLGTVTIEQG